MKTFLSRNKGIIIFYGLLILITLIVVEDNKSYDKKMSANDTGIQLADK